MNTQPPYSIGSNKFPGLTKLVEESGELLQVIGKIMAAGHDGTHWDGNNLRIELEKELADLKAAILFYEKENEVSRDRIYNRMIMKYNLFQKWHTEGMSV